MIHTFIAPETYEAFENEEAQIQKCKEWGLLSEKASKTKSFAYKGNGMNLLCSVVGYVDKSSAVIEFDNKQRHCIHPSYLKEMQASTFTTRIASAAADEDSPAAAEETPVEEISVIEAKSVAAVVEQAEVEQTKVESAKPELPEPSEPPKAKGKKEKPAKLQLPEDKVKMTATVQEFTTVPNNFSDTDDEVVIYEAVAITEPEMLELGTAWSSHSTTLKKMELAIGDTITFEAKVIAKKLTKHPVPYKINNPSKMQKA